MTRGEAGKVQRGETDLDGHLHVEDLRVPRQDGPRRVHLQEVRLPVLRELEGQRAKRSAIVNMRVNR